MARSAGVENAYKIGPALVEIGFQSQDLECARAAFASDGFSDALNWLEALVSSVSLVLRRRGEHLPRHRAGHVGKEIRL